MSDYQAQKIYTSEESAMESFYNELSKEQAITKINEILSSDFVGGLIDTYEFIDDVSSDFEIRVRDKRYKHPQANHFGIVLAEGSRSVAIILHELAHALTLGGPNSREIDTWHGEYFAFTYTKLVENFLGQDVYLDLVAAFITNGVDFTPEETKVKKKRKRFDDEIEKIWGEIEEYD